MDILEKVKAAFTMDRQQILGSYFYKNGGWENFHELRADARDVYASLMEVGATKEAKYFSEVASDCLGDIQIMYLGSAEDMNVPYSHTKFGNDWTILYDFDKENNLNAD